MAFLGEAVVFGFGISFAAVAPPLAVAGPPLVEGEPLTGVVGWAERALDNEAAVGLLSLSAAELLRVALRIGGAACGGAFLDLASEAAVGANRPEDGVLGLIELGVLGLLVCVAVAGVFGLAEPGVFGRMEEGVLGMPLVRGVLGVVGGGFGLRDEEVVDVFDWPLS